MPLALASRTVVGCVGSGCDSPLIANAAAKKPSFEVTSVKPMAPAAATAFGVAALAQVHHEQGRR